MPIRSPFLALLDLADVIDAHALENDTIDPRDGRFAGTMVHVDARRREPERSSDVASQA